MKILHNKHSLFFILALFIMLTSPLHPFANGFTDIDSSVYLYIGKSMTYGQFPYIDSFDHKGILIYLIDFVGYSLAGNTGIWLIEFIFLYVSIFFCYKTARFFVDKTPSLIATIVVFILFGWYFQEGNLVEEYAVPMIFISLYIFTKYFINRYNISNKNALITGFCLGFVLFLRPNMIAVWAVFCPIILFNLLFSKKYLKAVNLILFFGLGLLSISLPLLLLIIKNGALDDFIDQYFLFNANYSTKQGLGLTARLRAFYFYSNNTIFAISIGFFGFMLLIKNKYNSKEFQCYFSLFLFLIFSFISILVSGRSYEHYAMVIVPCYIIPIAFVVNFVYNKMLEINNNKSLALTAISTIFGLFLMYPIATELYRIKKTFDKTNECNELAKVIKNNSNKNEYITVVGNTVSIYLLSDRKSASKYVFQPVGYGRNNFNNKVTQRYIKDLTINEPKLICTYKGIIRNSIVNEKIINCELIVYLNNMIFKDYKLIYQSENYMIFKKPQNDDKKTQ